MATYYIDLDIGTASGSGTIGDPWGTFDYAMSSFSRIDNVTLLYIRGSEARSTSIAVPAASGSRQIVFVGYDSTPGDNGRFTVTFDSGSVDAISGGNTLLTWIQGDIVNLGTGRLLLGTSVVMRSKVSGHTGTGVQFSGEGALYDSEIVGGATGVILSSGFQAVVGNTFTNQTSTAVYLNGSGATVSRNKIYSTASPSQGIIRFDTNNANQQGFVSNNSIVLGGGIGVWISSNGYSGRAICKNNVVINAATGIQSAIDTQFQTDLIDNAYYGCTTDESFLVDSPLFNRKLSLSDLPYADPANGDWSMSGELSATVAGDGLTPGAIQATSAGGGVRIPNIRGGADQ